MSDKEQGPLLDLPVVVDASEADEFNCRKLLVDMKRAKIPDDAIRWVKSLWNFRRTLTAEFGGDLDKIRQWARDGKAQEWQPIETAPKGLPSNDVGCREQSEWFEGRQSDKYMRKAPYHIIARRGWPQDASWISPCETCYVSDYFDSWRPLRPTGGPS